MVVRRNDLDGFNGERLFAICREHSNKDVADYLNLGLVKCGDLDKDISCFRRDLGVIAVDYRR